MQENSTSIDSSQTKSSDLLNYFTKFQWFCFAVIVITGIALRWAELETRPFHHDESQHAMFGKYFYDFPEHQYYKYDPMMHAPLLYNFYRVVYTAFGNTNWSSRAPIAFMGTLFLFVPLFYRRYFSRTALLALTAGLALSPNMVYWSRFVIHDFFVLTSMLIALYGVFLADPRRKAFFVLVGFALQFCIKANVFVTAAILIGYLFYEALFSFTILSRESFKDKVSEFLSFLKKHALTFLGICAAFICIAHYSFSQISSSDENWGVLHSFASHIPVFLATMLTLALIIYIAMFLLLWSKETLLGRALENVKTYRWQFCASAAVAILIFCYIFSSGFRHSKGILDGLYRTSIPYWLHHHNIERIKGPFLFHFYMFAWYDIVFTGFFLLHLYFFYSSAGSLTRKCGLAILALASICALGTLYYITPETAGMPWKEVETVSLWKVFKLKDCLDVFGLILLLFHPVILTSTHLFRGEKILAFWGYFFTASFFSYSYLGEKVPWLSMYPLAIGFVYLALYFDDWFKRHPVDNLEKFSLSRVLKVSGLFMLSLGLLFTAETIVGISNFFQATTWTKFFDFFTYAGLTSTLTAIKTGMQDNLLLFLLGLTFCTLSYVNKKVDLLGTVNLKNLVFCFFFVLSLRAAILVNFVFAGSETEYISQVHTTKEFHELALRLRHEAVANIKAEPLKILADGDPVWPLTWYFVGVPDFKYSATAEEKKDFDYMIVTYDDAAKNVPSGFDKRRVNLRGWWVPNFEEMTFKKFLNYSLNHIPWSPSGFTYAWFLVNSNKK